MSTRQWPFAVLPAPDAVRVEVSGTVRAGALIVEHDDQGGILVLEARDVTCPLSTGVAAGFDGSDGSP